MKIIALMTLVVATLCGCRVVGPPPILVWEKGNHHQEQEDRFDRRSRIIITNASRYGVRIVRDGREMPRVHPSGSEFELTVAGRLHLDVHIHVLAIAYDHNGMVAGRVEKEFTLKRGGVKQEEWWVLKDATFK